MTKNGPITVTDEELDRVEAKAHDLMEDRDGDLDLASLITTLVMSHYWQRGKLERLESLLNDSMNEYDPIPHWAVVQMRKILEGQA